MQVAPGPGGPKSPSHRSPDNPSKEGAVTGPLRVLIVDDVRDTRELYQYFLRFQGVRALTAADGREALETIAAAPPDVVVLDLAMPHVTGWDVLRALKSDSRSRRIPIVVLSGSDARESALQAGADAYIEKPCLPDDLYREILKVLRRPGQPRDH